jgi:hypothetical protein
VAVLHDSGGRAQCQLPRNPFGSLMTPSARAARFRGRSAIPQISALQPVFTSGRKSPVVLPVVPLARDWVSSLVV